MLHIHISFNHGRSWAREGDATPSGGRVQGGGEMSVKDNILTKETDFMFSTGFKLLCKIKRSSINNCDILKAGISVRKALFHCSHRAPKKT
jgi:hypothetical protein